MEPNTHPNRKRRIIFLFIFLAVCAFAVTKKMSKPETHVTAGIRAVPGMIAQATQTAPVIPTPTPPISAPEPIPITTPETLAHIATPAQVRGVYLTGWSAGNAKSINHFFELASTANINTVVIDIKDATGKLSYEPIDENLKAIGSGSSRIADLPALIEALHQKNIYVIGRVSVFQDPFFASKHPEEAFTNIKTNQIWSDYNAIAWLRPNSQVVWDYTIAIARDAYAQGFDEVNLDYVRFPSDGDLSALNMASFTKNKPETIEDFFSYINTALRQESHIPISADLFGLTLSAQDDMGIGQKLELIAPLVDYICPMVYPSHFWAGSYGFANPTEHPYEVVHQSLEDGIAKLSAVTIAPEKLRPWLQVFNLGAVYTPEMVIAQTKAVSDSGLHSLLFWDPTNNYAPLQSFQENE